MELGEPTPSSCILLCTVVSLSLLWVMGAQGINREEFLTELIEGDGHSGAINKAKGSQLSGSSEQLITWS